MNKCIDCGKELKCNTTKRCRSCASKNNWKVGNCRTKCSSNEANHKRSETMKLRWRVSPEIWDYAILQTRAGYMDWLNHGGRDIKSAQMKEAWVKYRDTMLAAQNTSELKNKRSKIGKTIMSDAVRAQQHSDSVKRAWKRGAYDGVFVNPSGLERRMYEECLIDIHADVIPQYRPLDYNRVYDFYVPDMNLLIEVDGWYWHQSDMAVNNGQDIIDQEKETWAVMHGFRFIRVAECDINSEFMQGLVEELTSVM